MSVQGFANRHMPHGLGVLRACDFRVSNGANLGDPVSHAAELLLDDIFTLAPAAQRWRLSMEPAGATAHFQLTDATQMGCPGAAIHADCRATFMAPDGATVEALVLVELAFDNATIAAIYLLPLEDLHPRVEYALVDVCTSDVRQKLAQLACVSFSKGTHITMADGRQLRIEALRPGDCVLTRDNGPQAVRWVGQGTYRATGAFAPVVFAPGAVNNAAELRLSPNQRLFFYQREDPMRTGRSEVVARAELLINGTTIRRGAGGFVDYFQILFDSHEFVFAEGVATESLAFSDRTGPALPPGLAERLSPAPAGAISRPDPLDLPEGLLEPEIAAAVLRGASMA